MGWESVYLHWDAAAQLHAALGYALTRASAQPCPTCQEPLYPTGGAPDARWSCENGHEHDVEGLLADVQPCETCDGFGNVYTNA